MVEVSKYSLPKQTGLTSSKVYPVIPYTFQDDILTLPYSTPRELYPSPTLTQGRVGLQDFRMQCQESFYQ